MNQAQIEQQRRQEEAINNRHKQTPQQIAERRKRQAFFHRQLNARDNMEDRGAVMVPAAEDISLGLLGRIEKDMLDKAKKDKGK